MYSKPIWSKRIGLRSSRQRHQSKYFLGGQLWFEYLRCSCAQGTRFGSISESLPLENSHHCTIWSLAGPEHPPLHTATCAHRTLWPPCTISAGDEERNWNPPFLKPNGWSHPAASLETQDRTNLEHFYCCCPLSADLLERKSPKAVTSCNSFLPWDKKDGRRKMGISHLGCFQWLKWRWWNVLSTEATQASSRSRNRCAWKDESWPPENTFQAISQKISRLSSAMNQFTSHYSYFLLYYFLNFHGYLLILFTNVSQKYLFPFIFLLGFPFFKTLFPYLQLLCSVLANSTFRQTSPSPPPFFLFFLFLITFHFFLLFFSLLRPGLCRGCCGSSYWEALKWTWWGREGFFKIYFIIIILFL